MDTKIELTFPGKLKQEPIICNLCKKFDLTLNIIEASFSTEIGWAILVIHAAKGILDDSLAYLKEKGVKIENIQEITQS